MPDLEKKAEASTRIVLDKCREDFINYSVEYPSGNTKTGSFKGGLCIAVIEIIGNEIDVSTPIKMELRNFLAEEKTDIEKLFKAYKKIYPNLSYEFL